MMRAGTRLRSTVCETEVVVVKAPDGDLDVRGFFGFDDSVRPGFSGVRVKVEISGPESEEAYRALAATVDAHCPVLDLFSNPTPVETSVVVG